MIKFSVLLRLGVRNGVGLLHVVTGRFHENKARGFGPASIKDERRRGNPTAVAKYFSIGLARGSVPCSIRRQQLCCL